MSGENNLTPLVFDDENLKKPDPFKVFSQWLNEAKLSEINDANAMSLATIDKDMMPDCRIMLLNGMNEDGFIFYTNTLSAKGQELANNPKACLLFHWKSSRRQVRIRGDIIQVSDDVADEYFASRPRGSRIGAHASKQSSPMQTREQLAKNVEKFTEQFAGKEVPRPDHWTGFLLAPVQIEFWQNGEFRLHDRVTYYRGAKSQPWETKRLNP
ncbi:Pyridoxamine 5'-phosphate oxidase [hydrothermal vent metagenome]|uniref:Pyridoxamine 5'-phosphate oxidase n=1 Tax=hydrothermal vent metagenome TaxID=652676 RepID=A0A3B0U695_9ZZZZ